MKIEEIGTPQQKLDFISTNLFETTLHDDDPNWDQFEYNKEKFNVESTYSENNYTTDLNRDMISLDKKIEADKIEKVRFLYNYPESLFYEIERKIDTSMKKEEIRLKKMKMRSLNILLY